MTGLMERMENVAERGAFLRANASVQRQRAEEVVKSGDQAQALELLAAQKQLLDQETTLLAALEQDAAARGSAGLSAEQLALLRQANTEAQTHMAGPAYDELPLRLERLEEIVPGARWSGDPGQIKNALDHARRAGVPVDVVSHDPVTGRWDIRLRGRPMVLDETPRGGKARTQQGDLAPPRVARAADELGQLLERDPDAFIARYRQLAAGLEPNELGALKDAIRARGRVTPASSAGLKPGELVELHRRRVVALRAIGEFEQMAFHGTGSSMLDGLATTQGEILPAAELQRRGLTPTTGEGPKFTQVAGPKEFISVGLGESGFGTSLAYADASKGLAHYNPQLLSDADLKGQVDRLEYIIANFDSVKVDVQGPLRPIANREKGHFIAELDKVKRELVRRKDLPADAPQRLGGRASADTHPLLFEFDTRGMESSVQRFSDVQEGGALGGEGSVTGAIDLKRRLRRVYSPAEHVQAVTQRLQKILGHSDFEVLAIEALDNIPSPGMLGSSRVSTYKGLSQMEKEVAYVERAYETAIREGRTVDTSLIAEERTRK
jgi:hypothetical protein